MEKELEAVHKIVLAGDSGVGKTQLIQRFAKGTFAIESAVTVGIELSQRVVTVGEQNVRVQMWDTGGQERFRCISAPYFRGAEGVVLVYDITNKKSFEAMSYWIEEVRQKAEKDALMIVIGNKADISDQRKVSKTEGQTFAAQENLPWLEVSAKTGAHVADAFEALVERICKKATVRDATLKLRKTEGGSSVRRKGRKRTWC